MGAKRPKPGSRSVGGSKRPSLSIQNVEAMGSVFWTSSHDLEAQVLENRRRAAFEATDFCKETKLFLELAGVTSLMFLGFAVTPLITASYVGRFFGPTYLTAFSLANLMGNLCTQTLVTGLFGAIDTLSPQAIGKGDFAQVGYLAVRGVVSSLLMMIPVNGFLMIYLEDVLVAMGEDHVAAYHANQWYNIFVISLPFSILYSCLCKFLTVQRILRPVIVVSVLATMGIAPTLKVFAGCWGFLGTAVAYVLFWVVQSMLLLAYVVVRKPHDPRTWDTHLLVQKSLESSEMADFLGLGLGGIVAQCEWVFWEALGLVVGKLGVVAMTTHTIPTQIVMNVSTIPYAVGIALAVRMGISLPRSVRRAQCITIVVTALSMGLFGAASVVLYVYRTFFIEIFVNPSDTDPDSLKVFELAEDIWPTVSLFNANIGLFGILAGIASGLGKQWDLGMINLLFLWVLGMPVIYYTTIVRHENGRSGLKAAWFWMNVAYLGINLALIAIFVTADWYEIQKDILDNGDDDDDDDDDEGKNTKNDHSTNQLPPLLPLQTTAPLLPLQTTAPLLPLQTTISNETTTLLQQTSKPLF